MALKILVEPTNIRYNETLHEAYRFIIGRQIGIDIEPAVRVVIPKDANDPVWLADIHIAVPLLNPLKDDIKHNCEINWFERDRQQKLLDLLWTLYDKITAGNSADGGIDHLIDDYPNPTKPVAEPLPPDDKKVACRKAVALLRARNPQDFKSDIEQLRKKLFKEQKRWVRIPSGTV